MSTDNNNTAYRTGAIQPRWQINSSEQEKAAWLAEAIGALARDKLKITVNPRQQKLIKQLASRNLKVLAALLLNRGVDNAESALRFLCPDVSWLHPSCDLPDLEAAVARLEAARSKGERVLVHGDYDADGITATVLLVTAFRAWGLETSWYLPHRIDDGYGLSKAGIMHANDDGCTLLVTVDCGIGSEEEVEFAKSLGMDVIITDHHLPPARLPAALAVINPKRTDSGYPFPDLAGVGVAWKLAAAIDPDNLTNSACLQLAALGTVADMVPLIEENRIITKAGLEAMRAQPLPGIAALASAAGYDIGSIDASGIAFGLAPRLNAAGRMGSADSAAALLLESDSALAQGYAQVLHEDNQLRRQVEEEIFGQALVQAQEQFSLGRRILVLHGHSWHPGVVGIVAARILEQYYRPAVVLCGQDIISGSARSIPGFDIHAALSAVAEHLDSYGGHLGAAGLSLREENLELLRSALDSYALSGEIDHLLQPVINLDALLSPEDIDIDLINDIELLQPFGFGNSEPVFAVEGYRVGSLELAGKEKNHLRLALDTEKQPGGIWAIGFGKSSLVHNIDKGAQVRIAGSLMLNRWNGRASVQVRFVHLQGPDRFNLDGRQIIDRRKSSDPWLGNLVSAPGTVFIANTLWSARRLLAGRISACEVVIIGPDKYREKVYNLEADNFCFLDPAWNSEQLQEILALLPRGCSVHFFGSAIPEDILRPNLNLLRRFYRGWRDKGSAQAELLSLLPDDLAEPLLLERILAIFAEAGLAEEIRGNWTLAPVSGNVDLTKTKTWGLYSEQLEIYHKWLQKFAAEAIDQALCKS